MQQTEGAPATLCHMPAYRASCRRPSVAFCLWDKRKGGAGREEGRWGVERLLLPQPPLSFSLWSLSPAKKHATRTVLGVEDLHDLAGTPLGLGHVNLHPMRVRVGRAGGVAYVSE